MKKRPFYMKKHPKTPIFLSKNAHFSYEKTHLGLVFAPAGLGGSDSGAEKHVFLGCFSGFGGDFEVILTDFEVFLGVFDHF
jgi:hypothetical protein